MELEQLIGKFWKGETSAEENEHLLQLLQDYNEAYLDRMKNTFHRVVEEGIGEGDTEKASILLKEIHQRLGIDGLEERQHAKIISIRRLYKGLAVAASICILTVSVFLLIHYHPGATPPIAGKTVTPESGSGISFPLLVSMTNGADSTKILRLEDGSLVQLGKNSKLSVPRPFPADRRDIHLEGDAVFTVAKDRSRPFTVYAEGIATRALGTRFSVNTSDAGKVTVRLLEGKIVINAASGSGRKLKDVYLIPGQEFLFNKNNSSYAVNVPRAETGAKHPGPDNGSGLVFNKEPLGKVFQKIGSLYKAPLVFRQEQLKGLYFTGTFLKSDDLHIVLSAICNVNDLAFTEEKDSIIITRSH